VTQHTVEVEAETLEEARSRVRLQVPEGLHLLREEVVSDGMPRTVQGVADAVEAAYADAQSHVPAGAHIIDKRQLLAPAQKVITVEAPDEQSAMKDVASQAGDSATIKSLHMVAPGRRRLLVFGKTPNLYKARVFQQAVVEVTYQAPARIVATYGEKSGRPLALAVMAYSEGTEKPVTFRGTDADGQELALSVLTEAAFLFVPRDTLRHLRQNPALWGRVRSPSSVDAAVAGLRKSPEAEMGVLSAVLDSASDAAFADQLLPGEFQIAVVDTFHDAQLRVAAVQMFRRE